MCSSSLKTELRVCCCYLALSIFHPRHHILGINYRKELIFKDRKHIQALIFLSKLNKDDFEKMARITRNS
jgi:hypothetical protein